MGAPLSHRCPVCARLHQVNEARASVAYGRQLTCSPACESARRHRAHDRNLQDSIYKVRADIGLPAS